MVSKGSTLSLLMPNGFLLTNSDFYPVSVLTQSFSAISVQVQHASPSAHGSHDLGASGCPSLTARRKSTELFGFHPVNLSVGFRIPFLAGKLLHSGGRRVPSPTSQIPGIRNT